MLFRSIAAGLDYLDVAPTVVEVVRTLDLPQPDTHLRPLDDDQRAAAVALAETWALGASVSRVIEALATTR